MANKNIWIISQYAGSPYHGMGYRSYYLAQEFIKKGSEVKIFSGSYSHQYCHQPNIDGLFTDEAIEGVQYTWVKVLKYKKSTSIGRVASMLMFSVSLFFYNIFKIKKPDVIIISSLSLFPIVNAYVWSRVFKVKLIFEIRDLWPLTLTELNAVTSSHPFTVVLKFFANFGYRKADYVVSLLENSKEYLIKNGMKENKFRYIPNGIYTSKKKNNNDLDWSVSSLIPKDNFIVGYSGSIGIPNAMEYLIKAAELLKDHDKIYFVIVGDGSEKEGLAEYSRKNKLRNIIFINTVEKKMIPSLLKLFDVCYIGWYKKSIYDYGISANKIFDYMYAAKPILHSFSSEKSDLIKKANCGITVEAEEINSIKNGIYTMYRMSNKERDQLGKNGKKFVLECHNYEALAEKYMEIILE